MAKPSIQTKYISRVVAALCGLVVIALALYYWIGAAKTPGPSFDPQRYSFTLERTGCLGYCPAFVLDVQADGATSLRMHTVVANPNAAWSPSEVTFTSAADRSQRLALISTVEHGEFWRLHSAYSMRVTDTSSTRITVATPDRRWSVDVHAVRCQSQRYSRSQEDPERGPVPDVFCALERKLNAIACQTYEQGKSRKLLTNEEVFNPVSCPSDT